jgi:hypothetical protein
MTQPCLPVFWREFPYPGLPRDIHSCAASGAFLLFLRHSAKSCNLLQPVRRSLQKRILHSDETRSMLQCSMNEVS